MPDFTQLTPTDRRAMLAAVGVSSAEALFEDVPAALRFPTLNLPPAMSEMEVAGHMATLADENVTVDRWPSFLGAGVYDHYAPAAVHHIMDLPQFSTAYTPYQAEVSQGTLQASFEFQSMVCDLLALEAANSSVYDGASATAEAVLMALRITQRHHVLLAGSLNPHWRRVVETYLSGRGVSLDTTAIGLREGKMTESDPLDQVTAETACVVVQQPDFFGHIPDLSGLAGALHDRGVLLVVAVAEASSLGLLKPPGEWGADIAAAEAQALGLALQFGGPWAGMLACRGEYLRQLPGRIAGQTLDVDGRRGYVLTLQAREQHIRREKATSNICTAQTLPAIGVSAYLGLMGPRGLQEVAAQAHAKATFAAGLIGQLTGYEVLTAPPFYNEVLVRCPVPAASMQRALLDKRILGGLPVGGTFPELADCLLLAFTERSGRADIERLVAALDEVRA